VLPTKKLAAQKLRRRPINVPRIRPPSSIKTHLRANTKQKGKAALAVNPKGRSSGKERGARPHPVFAATSSWIHGRVAVEDPCGPPCRSEVQTLRWPAASREGAQRAKQRTISQEGQSISTPDRSRATVASPISRSFRHALATGGCAEISQPLQVRA